ncbi:hypothetical protein [Streptomyces sp. NPDC059575]|uniref:hypothetical protein n=1 Tax=Streptomyces sp. NPDC059575 TaxID=3346872 RepID=UPI0036BBDB31
MSAVRNTLTSVVSAVVLAGGLAVGAAGHASASACPSSSSPLIGGAEAHWSIRCSGRDVVMSGWVQDTRADGKCAVVRINAGNGKSERPTACGSGARKQFSYKFTKTNKAEGRLALV